MGADVHTHTHIQKYMIRICSQRGQDGRQNLGHDINKRNAQGQRGMGPHLYMICN